MPREQPRHGHLHQAGPIRARETPNRVVLMTDQNSGLLASLSGLGLSRQLYGWIGDRLRGWW